MESGDAEQAMRALRQRYGAGRVSRFGDRLHLTVPAETTVDDVLRVLGDGRIAAKQAAEVEFSLEDVFISLIQDRRHEIPQ